MRKHHLIATVALAVLGLLAPVAQAASDAPSRPAASKAVKKSVKKSAKKNVTRSNRKAAVEQPRSASRRARSKLAAQPARRPPSTARSVQLPPRTITASQLRTDVRTRLTKPGDYRFAIQHEGRTRTYRVHVPPGLDFHEPAPLLVALHGGSVGEQANAGLYGLARESDRQRFVTVFPDAYREPGGRAGWNAASSPTPLDDVGFIDKVVDNVFRQVSIERLQIYAAGMADGGSMAYRLACDRPHVFRAVASVGGTDTTTDCAPDKPVSILQFQARNDAPTVLASLRGGGASAPDRSAETAAWTAAKWAKRNGCMEAPHRILEMSGAYCEAWSYCRQQTEVRLCVTDGGGQAWPGEPASHAISATSTMWGFFSSR